LILLAGLLPAQHRIVGVERPIAIVKQPAAVEALPALDESPSAGKPAAPSESALAVPEPSMLLAVGGGLVLLALAKRRRRGRSSPLV
jgi:hypothetical protein